MIPHWQLQHDWWMQDFHFEIECAWQLKIMLRKHPDDQIGVLLRSIVVMCDKRLGRLRRAYKAIYGCLPKLTRIRKEVER